MKMVRLLLSVFTEGELTTSICYGSGTTFKRLDGDIAACISKKGYMYIIYEQLLHVILLYLYRIRD